MITSTDIGIVIYDEDSSGPCPHEPERGKHPDKDERCTRNDGKDSRQVSG